MSGKKKKKESAEQEKQEVGRGQEVESAAGGESIEEQLAAAQQELAELKDKLLRAYAEMDNLRKRTQREIEESRKYAIEKFAVALLDVIDNLERALDAPEGNEEAVREGVRLTLNQWHDVMKRFSIERIDALGKEFDPHHHEALSQMPSEEPEGKVIAQHVAGYLLNGRLIRPAKVLVSSGPPAPATEKTDQSNREEGCET